jgi:hypothetical protein
VAAYDYARTLGVLDWPVRELLVAYVDCMKAAALEAYRHAQLVYWLQVPCVKKPGKPPKVPSILK